MRRFVILATLLAMIAVIAPAAAVAGGVVAKAELSGAAEVPANDAPAFGKVKFKLTDDGVAFKMMAHKLSGPVWGAHIHNAAAGANGPVIAKLCGAPPVAAAEECTTSKKGKLKVRGVITADNLNGVTMDELMAAVGAGEAYVNLHTDAYPGGEIRGQIIP